MGKRNSKLKAEDIKELARQTYCKYMIVLYFNFYYTQYIFYTHTLYRDPFFVFIVFVSIVKCVVCNLPYVNSLPFRIR